MVFPNWGPAEPPLQSPHRAPRPNRKFLTPVHPELKVTSVITAMTEQMRVFMLSSFICIASVFGSLKDETTKN